MMGLTEEQKLKVKFNTHAKCAATANALRADSVIGLKFYFVFNLDRFRRAPIARGRDKVCSSTVTCDQAQCVLNF